jgi:uncharacterized protein YehS (DUF1456 family)
MINNHVLRGLRYALDLKDATMGEIFQLVDFSVDQADIINMLRKEEEPNFLECSNDTMICFLDGLIIYKRGALTSNQPPAKESNITLTNNIMLKKIRIALELKEEDLLKIIKLAEFQISKSELSALFRKPGHKNYRQCGDQFVRNLLRGIIKFYRS